MNTVFTLLVILLVNILSIKLYLSGDLTLYIHPRYILFTVVMNGMSLGIVTLGLLLQTVRIIKARNLHLSMPSLLGFLTAAFVLLGLLLPARPLLSSTVDQRYDAGGQGAAVIRTDSSSNGSGLCREIGPNNQPHSFQHWHNMLMTCDNPLTYRGQKIALEGFVYGNTSGTPAIEGTFSLARFRISCCAVDAYPMILPIKSSGSQQNFVADEWLRVEGTIQPFKTSDGSMVAVIEPTKIQKILSPDDPYEFIEY